ncbi:hypothetical protein MMC13_003258 [Lambiella insularis]|nr:hypothetical protein [Lambiella insularis]
MAALRPPNLRTILPSNSSILRFQQRRWAQVHDVRFLATHHQSDKITEKYRAKLDKKAKEIGLRDVAELKQVYKDKVQQARVPTIPGTTSPFPPPPPPPRIPESEASSPLQQSSSLKPAQAPGLKTLSSFLDVPKTLTLSSSEISRIWRLRHASSPSSLCAIIPASTYFRIAQTAQKHPQFILPLPRGDQNAEIHFLQWTFPSSDTATVLFTHLAEYKLRGEYSQPHTTVTHHLELAKEKGVVLLQGSVVEGRGVSVEEGRWLVMCLQKFYGGEGERKKMLEMFSSGEEGFRVERLVEEAEKVP